MSEKSPAAVLFESCEEFYKQTREANIEALCEAIRKNTHAGKKSGEDASWRHSLPDFAKLLSDPEEYRKDFLAEAESLVKKIDTEINVWKYVLSALNRDGIGEALDSSSSSRYQSIVENAEGFLEHLKEQKEKLEKLLKDIPNKSIGDPLKKVQVEIEYPLSDRRRIDVLLSKPDTNKYAIIELKQWTEKYIYSAEDGFFHIAQNKNKLVHPLRKVEEYRDRLREKLNGDANIQCVVYLHNQMYINGILYTEAKKENINLFEGNGKHNSILYTKPWHWALLEKLHGFFDDPPKTEA